MPKVIHLAQYYWPHVGGVENHLEQINKQLVDKKYQISVIALRHDQSLPLTEKHQQVAIYRLPLADPSHKLTHKLTVWQGITSLRHLLFTADIIHIHDVFWWLIPLLPFLNRQKLYITFHGYEGNEPPRWNQIFWHRLAAWWTNGNICIGDFHHKWYGVRPTAVSYGGVESHRTQQPIKKNTHTLKKKTEGLFLGRLESDNGLLKYLQAIKLLHEKGQQVSLKIFGDGKLRSEAENFVKKNKLPVIFYGFSDKASTHLATCDVALVSRYLSLIEALAAGVPVIAQYNNQLQYDYLTLTPFAQWITIVHTPADIATAMQKNQPSPPAAQQWAKSQTWDKVAKMYRELWQN